MYCQQRRTIECPKRYRKCQERTPLAIPPMPRRLEPVCRMRRLKSVLLTHLICCAIDSTSSTMDTFDNFQYDSASSYGGMGVVDDNSSVYTANTQDNTAESIDLSSLSISNHSPTSSANGHGAHHRHRDHNTGRVGVEEDFDAVLDDLKDEGAVDLPPHACRYVNAALFLLLASRYKSLLHTM
jgi:hypothetical protein